MGLIDFDTFVITYLIVFFVYAVIKSVRRRKTDKKTMIKSIVIEFLFAGFFVCVAGVTLSPISIPPERAPIEWRHLVSLDLLKMIDYPYVSIAAKNILGNILMMVPLIPLYGLWKRNKQMKLKTAFVIAFLVSLSIEVLQQIENITGLSGYMIRTSDINDVICNVTGALAGFGIYKVCIKFFVSKAKAPDDSRKGSPLQ